MGNEQFIYSLGRGASIVARPATLYIATLFLPGEISESVAVVFLASMLALVATAADPHRKYYKNYFSDKKANALSYAYFVVGSGLLGCLGSLVTFAIVYLSVGQPIVAAIAVIYFLSEKIGDEILRFRLFQRDFYDWGLLSIVRAVIQLATTGTFIFFEVLTLTWQIVLALTLANLIVFVPAVPKSAWLLFLRRSLHLKMWLGKRTFWFLIDNRLLWFIALVGASVGYIDRVAIMVVDKSLLPLFMLIVSCFSIVQMGLDFFYVSYRRRDFLEGSIKVVSAILDIKFILALLSSVIVALVMASIVLIITPGGENFPVIYLVAVAVVQIALAVTSVPHQILYWSERLDLILRIDLAFWLLLLCFAGSLILLSFTMVWLLVLIAFFVFLRSAAFVLVSRSVDAAQPS